MTEAQNQRSMRKRISAMAFAAGLAMSVMAMSTMVSVLAATGDAAPAPPARVQMSEEGPVFTTPAGMTLYTYPPDDGSPGKPQCTNVRRADLPDPTAGFGKLPLPLAETHPTCIQKWPPFMADAAAQAGGDWSLINRPEGGKQWAYRGHPLYTSIKDHKPGDINGDAQGVGQGGRDWHLALAPLDLPPGLMLVRRPEGLVLATMNGRPVYAPHGAHPQKACSGCGELFQPIDAPAVGNVTGDWSIVEAGAGRRQYVFKGKPLFAAPESLADSEIAEDGGWETVVYRKGAGTPAQIQTNLSLLGYVYTDTKGKTLYVFTCTTPVRDGVRCDDPGDPAEYWVALCGQADDCARRWHPYLAPADARGVGDWSVVDVAYPMFKDATGTTYPPGTPRVKAWAYRGRPLYTYFDDKGPGDIWGAGMRWFGYSNFIALQVPGHGLLD